LLGVDQLGGPLHGADVVALEPGWVFAIDAAVLARRPELIGWLRAAVAKEQGGAAAWALAMARPEPRQRVAAFLLDIAARHAAARMDPWSLPIDAYWPYLENALALSCDEIAGELAALGEAGLIDHDLDTVAILDLDGLRLAADPLATVAACTARH
jgi:CRP/FNR family transcriptional regulator